jgi:hypothetical protein
MLEAKGAGFADKMTGPDTWLRWYRAIKEMQIQMQRQSDAAVNRRIEWHFAEPELSKYFENYALRFPHIVVIYTPAIRP